MKKSFGMMMRSLTTAFRVRVSRLTAAGSVSVLWYSWAPAISGNSRNRKMISRNRMALKHIGKTRIDSLDVHGFIVLQSVIFSPF